MLPAVLAAVQRLAKTAVGRPLTRHTRYSSGVGLWCPCRDAAALDYTNVCSHTVDQGSPRSDLRSLPPIIERIPS